MDEKIVYLQKFLNKFLDTLPGKELGQDVIEFNRFLGDVGLNKIVTLNERGELSFALGELEPENILRILGQILEYLEDEIEPLAESFIALFVKVFSEVKSESIARDRGLQEVLRKHSSFFYSFGLLDQLTLDVELPPIFKLLKPCGAIIFKEEKPSQGYDVLKQASEHNFKAVCLTKLEPSKIRDRYDLRNAKIAWLTFSKSEDSSIRPDELNRIIGLISDCSAGSVILFDCFHEIKIVNGFDKTVKFLGELKKLCVEKKLVILISINPTTFHDNQLILFERELEEIRV